MLQNWNSLILCPIDFDFFRHSKTHKSGLEQRQYQNGFVSVKNMFVLNFAALFSLLCSWGKSAVKFKTNMFFTETNPFLYCLCSRFLFWLVLFVSKRIILDVIRAFLLKNEKKTEKMPKIWWPFSQKQDNEITWKFHDSCLD